MLNTFTTLLGTHTAALRHYLLCSALYGLLSGLTLSLLAPILSALLHGDSTQAGLWLMALAGALGLGWPLRLWVERAGVAVALDLLRNGRQHLGEHVARLPLGWFSTAHTARLGHLINHGLMALAQLPAHVFTPLISGALSALVVVGALCLLNGTLGLIAVLGLPLLFVTLRYSARLAQRSGQAYETHFIASSQRLLEFAQAQPVLRAFNAQGHATAQLEQALADQQRSARRLIWRSTLATVLNGWVVQGLFAALLLSAAWRFADLATNPADIVLLVVALVMSCRYTDALLEVVNQLETLRSAVAPLSAAAQILDAQPLPEPEICGRPSHAGVCLDAVHLRYARDQPEVLRGVSLTLAPGTLTALVGPSGSGKTSLVGLVARCFDVSQGSVRIGGVDVRQLSGQALAEQVSQVFQDTWLFQGSIGDNILMGRPQATALELQDAVQMAGVDEIIARLPDGLQTQVGEGGARLSGGERQRISIARALIKQAPILLLDEACAALDGENRALIARALARLRGRCTVLVIAHQLSTVAMAEQIVVLDQGEVVEAGSPAQLRERNGRYATMLAQQATAKRWHLAGSPEHAAP
ncbi:ABC transporter ATP-binding protein [Pseudomonas sp. RP23018S]|uniref:ABC transporter ATP-binding protein n=1 Tax=Pseudomonas sp. RP23018S TaxID=3096037 RepID=UPI002ACAE9D6|nr:ABC transporter ATP-binding protein [Pseudomonas sp. RP23018S]MDZ5602776.1 ABC transporter ATP-binding protein [Pseudomonas sp. RP23018S]